MTRRLLALLAGSLAAAVHGAAPAKLGLFTGATDVGAVGTAGTAAFDPVKGAYTVGGSGENMWFDRDAFHFVWTKVSGDLALSADVILLGEGGHPHRKAVLMFRRDLTPDSPYAGAALHGDGLTSLQFREEKGGPTREVQANLARTRRLRIEKTGGAVHLLAAAHLGAFQPTGCAVQVDLPGEFYVGIGVCAHDNEAFAEARFSSVAIGAPGDAAGAVRSVLEVVPIDSGDRRCVHAATEPLGPPRWTEDGQALLFDSGGKALRLALTPGAKPEPVGDGAGAAADTAAISPDGQWAAEIVRSGSGAAIRLRPVRGGEARMLVHVAGAGQALGDPVWSPDGTRLAYVRNLPAGGR